MLPSLPKLWLHCLHCRGGFFLSGLGLLTVTMPCLPRLEVLGLLLLLFELDLLEGPLMLVLLLPLLELDDVAGSLLLELVDLTLEDAAELGAICAGSSGERLLGGESPT